MWPNPQESADLALFTEGILNGKLYFLCSVKALKTLLIWFFSKILNVMLIGVILIVKVNWKRKTCSLNYRFFK